MSQIQSLKPIQSAHSKREHDEALLKEFALGVLLSNTGEDRLAFRLCDLTECANSHAGISVQLIESEVLGEDKVVILQLIPKEEQKPKSNIIVMQ